MDWAEDLEVGGKCVKFAGEMSKFKTRKRYRLTFVNENTFNAVWSLKLSRAKVWALSAVCVASIAALGLVVVVGTPLSVLLPGYLKPSQRQTSVESVLRVDSLLGVVENRRIYVDNLLSVLTDSSASVAAADTVVAEVGDTLMTATENEREFVRSWAERERNSLSVLTPVVAEGMLFRVPAVGAGLNDDESDLVVARGATVGAINDGTVAACVVDASTGRFTVVVQHVNDFLSVTSGLQTVFVKSGARVLSGQAIGTAGPDGVLPLSIWHDGRRIRLTAVLPIEAD